MDTKSSLLAALATATVLTVAGCHTPTGNATPPGPGTTATTAPVDVAGARAQLAGGTPGRETR
ncbi:hypothetical protein [Amycolatopsis minnesotensis]|uniref:Uncharacterized protein n=1 Tax=Amycolatopsis minnesotensis TaxID=337894 RepID=A0ABN2SH14_9PSEU